jgi:hypothetical protein
VRWQQLGQRRSVWGMCALHCLSTMCTGHQQLVGAKSGSSFMRMTHLAECCGIDLVAQPDQVVHMPHILSCKDGSRMSQTQ